MDTLTDDLCYQALKTRDARFDGRFYTAVVTTGIFCRPICPAVTPRRDNVRVSPSQHARARRLLRARQLIVDSNLSMTEIADIAGFGSLRRFNQTLKEAYGDAPTAWRRGLKPPVSASRQSPQSSFLPARDDLVLFLQARPPFDSDELLSFFRARAIPGLESVGEQYYARSVFMQGQHGLVICRPQTSPPGVQIIVRGPARQAILEVSARVRRLFDLDAALPGITAHLARDPILQPLVRQHPGLRVPGCWDRFEFAVRAVLGQQISIMAARTLAGRLVARLGSSLPADLTGDTGITHQFPSPEAIARQPPDNPGMPQSRADTLAQVAARFTQPGFSELDANTLLSQLASLRGIGPWTLNYLSLRGLGDPDAFPASDLGLLKASASLGGPTTAGMLARHAERWRPWRAYAAQYLWTSLTNQSGQEETLS